MPSRSARLRISGRSADACGTVCAMPRTLVAIPALNEAATIGAVIDEVRRAVPGVDILVVDDGSTDATADVARRAGAQVVSLPFNVGVGGAMRTAFLYAQRHDYDAVVQVDADGQHVAAPHPRPARRPGGGVRGGRVPASPARDYPVRGPRRWAMRVLARSLSPGLRDPAHRHDVGLPGRRPPGDRPVRPSTTPPSTSATRSSRWSSPHGPGCAWREVPVEMRPARAARPATRPSAPTLYLGRAMLALYVALARRPVRGPLPRRAGGRPHDERQLAGPGCGGAAARFVVELLRRGILRERFAALWLVVSGPAGAGARCSPAILSRAADALGFEVASNLLFFSAILFLLLVCDPAQQRGLPARGPDAAAGRGPGAAHRTRPSRTARYRDRRSEHRSGRGLRGAPVTDDPASADAPRTRRRSAAQRRAASTGARDRRPGSRW